MTLELFPEPWPTVFVATIGAIFGSFLNVCIYRLPAGLSIVWPPSHCTRCMKRIAWYDNLPLLSLLILRGRCRHCGATISARYLAVEALGAVCALAGALLFGLGRVRSADKNAPRTIDLDIALYGAQVIDDPLAGLRIPDPEIPLRAYLALPLAEVGPETVHPETGERLADIAERLAGGAEPPRRLDLDLGPRLSPEP